MDTSQNDNHSLPPPHGTTQQSISSVPSAPTSTSSSGGPGIGQPSAAGPQASTYFAQATDLPATAGDIDLIEKEWVLKAKAIVAATVGDPRRQSEELNNAKQQYISKRFNKELPSRD